MTTIIKLALLTPHTYEAYTRGICLPAIFHNLHDASVCDLQCLC
jgi:hypothetical protein